MNNNVPSRFSPAQGHFDKLRREGRCVTAPHDLTNAGRTVVPVDPAEQKAEIPPPDDDTMHDG